MTRSAVRPVALAIILVAATDRGAAEDVFYVADRANATDLGTTPKAVTVPGGDKAPKAAPRNDVVVRHNLEKNERTEILRLNWSITNLSVSAKGDRLTYGVVGRGAAEWQIVVIDLDGKTVARLTGERFKEKFNGAPLGAAALSPDGGTIVFGAQISPAPRTPAVERIVAFDVKTQALTDLGPGGMPTWSPDGKTILFTDVSGDRPQNATFRLSAMVADGTGRKAIGDPLTCNGAFSPDGKRIAFVKVVGGASEVWTCAADGSGAKKVAAPKSLYSSPRWLSDGRRLTVVARFKDMQPAVQETIARMKAKKGGKDEPPGSGNLEHLSRVRSYEPIDVYVISTDGPAVRRLSWLRGEGADEATRFFVDSAVADAIGRAADRQAAVELPIYVPPDGWTVMFVGTKVVLRDRSGATKPLPDGAYKLGPNTIITVVNGEKVIGSGG